MKITFSNFFNFVVNNLILVAYIGVSGCSATLRTIDHGEVKYDLSSHFKQTATYYCIKGYELIGNKVRHCILGGWAGHPATCHGEFYIYVKFVTVTITYLHLVNNMNILYFSRHNRYNVCLLDFVLVAQEAMTGHPTALIDLWYEYRFMVSGCHFHRMGDKVHSNNH